MQIKCLGAEVNSPFLDWRTYTPHRHMDEWACVGPSGTPLCACSAQSQPLHLGLRVLVKRRNPFVEHSLKEPVKLRQHGLNV